MSGPLRHAGFKFWQLVFKFVSSVLFVGKQLCGLTGPLDAHANPVLVCTGNKYVADKAGARVAFAFFSAIDPIQSIVVDQVIACAKVVFPGLEFTANGSRAWTRTVRKN